AVEPTAKHLPHGPDQERLPQPRHALDQYVPVGQKRLQDPADQPILANEYLVDLAQHPLRPLRHRTRFVCWLGGSHGFRLKIAHRRVTSRTTAATHQPMKSKERAERKEPVVNTRRGRWFSSQPRTMARPSRARRLARSRPGWFSVLPPAIRDQTTDLKRITYERK